MLKLKTWCDAPTSMRLELLLKLKDIPYTLESIAPPSIHELIHVEVDAFAGELPIEGSELPKHLSLDSFDFARWLDAHHEGPSLLPRDPQETDHLLDEALDLRHKLHRLVCAFRWFSPRNEAVLQASLAPYQRKLKWRLIAARVRRAMKTQLRIDPKALGQLVPRFDQILRGLNDRLETHPYLGGETLRLNDIVAYTHLMRATYYCEGQRIAHHKHLLVWFERMLRTFPITRPEWAQGHDFTPRKPRSGYQVKSIAS